MNPDEATRLARRIVNTWRLVPPIDVWTEYLIDLDHDGAHAAFTELLTTAEHGPAVATFHRMYRKHTRPPDPQPDDDEGERISLEEYIHRLTIRAKTSLDAQKELAIWQRNRHGLGKRL